MAEAEIIALAGWPPEVLAYGYAMYSRSALSIRESLKKISAEKAGEKTSKFFEEYYFKYGHASIADNAHISLALENISQIAAFEVEDEQLWDGQERSTRYQAFKRGGGYYIPQSVKGTPLEAEYVECAEFLLGEYEFFSQACFDIYVKGTPKPPEITQDSYERTLRARAFDLARYFLFGGILTSVGQITNARTLERQISRLMSSEYPELRDTAEMMKQACIGKPHSPEGKDEPPVAPTLVKYTQPNKYLIETRSRIREAVREMEMKMPVEAVRRTDFVHPGELSTEIIATILYGSSQFSYDRVCEFVKNTFDFESKEDFIKNFANLRGPHDPSLREFAAGYPVQFDVVMDRGGARDLHRHRRCIQILQALSTLRGFDVPDLLDKEGLGDRFRAAMVHAKTVVDKLEKDIGVDAHYLIPFAFRSGMLYKMDFAEAGYIIELRSKVGGHFSYREVACDMHNQLAFWYPELAKSIRVTPLVNENLLKR